ncbi:MAG: hypothetical protein WAU78_00475 [Roseiarcus sp.]
MQFASVALALARLAASPPPIGEGSQQLLSENANQRYPSFSTIHPPPPPGRAGRRNGCKIRKDADFL